MDIWSDQQLRSYLALTEHWVVEVPDTSALKLRTALIAFHRLNQNHTGESLAKTVILLLDRARITKKVRYVLIVTDIHGLNFAQGGPFHDGQCIQQSELHEVP
jgi:hypothetical protein